MFRFLLLVSVATNLCHHPPQCGKKNSWIIMHTKMHTFVGASFFILLVKAVLNIVFNVILLNIHSSFNTNILKKKIVFFNHELIPFFSFVTALKILSNSYLQMQHRTHWEVDQMWTKIRNRLICRCPLWALFCNLEHLVGCWKTILHITLYSYLIIYL